MRAVVQRVSRGEVRVDGEVVGTVGRGVVVFLGVAQGDTEDDAAKMARKIVGLRVFEDAEGKMNLALGDVGGAVLLISQFTLLGDCRRGLRPSFVGSALPSDAEALYLSVGRRIREAGIPLATGRFRAQMEIDQLNDGPVTLLLDSAGAF